MGCAFGKEISESGSPGGDRVVEKRREKRELSVTAESGDKAVESSVSKAEGGDGGGGVQNGGVKKEHLKDGIVKQSRNEKRRSRPNPRLSNPPNHVHGEQVAAGWPSWLVAVAGEALSGWIPRRADTFEKLDKVFILARDHAYPMQRRTLGGRGCLYEHRAQTVVDVLIAACEGFAGGVD